MNVKLINKEKEEELKELREQSINIINDKEMVGWYIELQTVGKDYYHVQTRPRDASRDGFLRK